MSRRRGLATTDDVLTGKRALVRVPIAGRWSTLNNGSGSGVSVGSTSGSNPDGSSQSVSLNAGLSDIGSYALIEGPFYGRQFGVAFERDVNAARAPFAVIIDGTAYRVGDVSYRDMRGVINSAPDTVAVVASPVTDAANVVMVADDLPDGPHFARIVMTGKVGEARSIRIYGVVVDASIGNVPIVSPGSIPSTSDAVQAPTSAGSVQYVGRVSQLFVSNTGTASRVVTIRKGGQVFRTMSLPAGGADQINFASPISLNGFTIQVDAGADVRYWTVTGASQ